MTKKNALYLKEGREKPIANGHPWIFSGAVARLPDLPDGSLCQIYSSEGQLLGSGYFNTRSQIVARLLAFDDTDPLQALKKHLDNAWLWRQQMIDPTVTTAYRLVNAEGDFLSGLVIDRYLNCFVIQISTLGMAQLLPHVLAWLFETFTPEAIVERSHGASRREEGLADADVIHMGTLPSELLILEEGLPLLVMPGKGQKTGFFCDQREMRSLIRQRAFGRDVLNAFGYTGAFSAYALAGGANSVTTLDSSASALALAERNAALQEQGAERHHIVCEDATAFFRQSHMPYDLVILDPPAFAKKERDIEAACRGYQELNRAAMEKLPKNSLMLTCSCSYHVSPDAFQKAVFRAARQLQRPIQIIGRQRLAPDHPLHLSCLEGDYLKGLFLRLM